MTGVPSPCDCSPSNTMNLVLLFVVDAVYTAVAVVYACSCVRILGCAIDVAYQLPWNVGSWSISYCMTGITSNPGSGIVISQHLMKYPFLLSHPMFLHVVTYPVMVVLATKSACIVVDVYDISPNTKRQVYIQLDVESPATVACRAVSCVTVEYFASAV